MTPFEKLSERFRQISRLNELRALASWDEAVMMPEGAGPFRNEALAELAVLIQNLTCDTQVGEWLEKAEGRDEWEKANLREMKRIYLENTVIPPELNQKLVVARMNCEQQWRKLRAENNWSAFLPHLQEVLNLTREMTQELARKRQVPLYDAALDLYSPGLTTVTVEKLFNELKSFLPEFIANAVEKQKSETVHIPRGQFPMKAQKALGLELMEAVGFSRRHGRLDESHHPFCGGSPRDVRITTRYREDEFVSALMGVLHETGHALYEQHLPEAWLTQPVGAACGMAIHESQSLLMEMQVVRSREFLEFAAPLIRRHMEPHTENTESLEPENLARLVTRVKPGLIRVDADEVTYPAHIILRFEIERDLLDDRWPLSELPAVWNDKMQTYLGLSTLGDDRNGCMQDVHWPSGAFGYFPAYTFGAVIAAQLFREAQRQRPSLKRDIAAGNFTPLRMWLSENIWSRGSSLSTLDLVEKVSGSLSTAPFREHLEARYG